MRKPEDGVEIVGVDSTGQRQDMSILEKEGIAYDPGNMTVELSKAERLRTTALMMAIQAYQGLIIKDAEYLVAASREAGHNPDFKIRPATMDAMVEGAIQFELFISGAYSHGIPVEKVGDAIRGGAAAGTTSNESNGL